MKSSSWLILSLLLGFFVLLGLPACTFPTAEADLSPTAGQVLLAEPAAPSPTPMPTPAPTNTQPPPPSATPFQPVSTTPAITPTPINSPTPTPTETPAWVQLGPGKVTVPILLYHKIRNDTTDTRYNVKPAVFEQQMRLLAERGYHTITITQLEEAILHGALLPPRPFVLTFDDGYTDIYQTAYPILQPLGFTGTVYIVGNYLHSKNFMDASMLKELVSAGWEVGSHSQSHADLTQLYDSDLRAELVNSKLQIEKEVEIKVRSFAYPYGLFTARIGVKTANHGYTNAVGLGLSTDHDLNTLYYLSRVEIYGTYTLDDVVRLLHLEGP